jgi:serine/threonine protein kinase
MATCPSCQKHYPDGTHACADDGESLLPDEAFASADRDLVAGQTVGEYRIEGKLGEGGFGTVYRSVHPLIGKTAAIKVLSRQYSSHPQMVSRFIAEARAVNQIRHRNIIDIFSFGSLPDGRHYFVMELLDGMPLDRYLKQNGKLSPSLAVPILRLVGRALDAAHASGIAHRDLKPENIFLTFDDDGQPFPKLLDFGIAKLMGEASGGPNQAKTKTGTPMGTPYYMSPEQCRGKDVDHRTDIYSFGIMAHELMTGELPFRGDDVLELMLKHTREPPPRISQVVPELPAAIDAPVLRMLAKDPAERPASLGAAVEELARAAKDGGLDVSLAPARSEPRSGGAVVDRVSSGNMTPAELQSLGSASTIASVPVAESPARTFQGATQDVPAAAKSRIPRLFAMGIPVVVGAVGAFFFLRNQNQMHSEPAAAASAAPVETSAPAAATPSAPVEPVVKAHEVAVTINSTPEHAVVLRDGKKIGESPGPIMLPQGEGVVRLVLKVDGYRPNEIKVHTNRDSTHDVTLLKNAAKAPAGKPAKPDTKGEIPGSIDEK